MRLRGGELPTAQIGAGIYGALTLVGHLAFEEDRSRLGRAQGNRVTSGPRFESPTGVLRMFFNKKQRKTPLGFCCVE